MSTKTLPHAPAEKPRRPSHPRGHHKMAHAATRQLERDIPQPQGVRRKLGRVWSRLLTAIVIRFPVPSEVKWQYTLDFARTLTVEYYEDLRKTVPESDAQAMVSQALFTSGRQWMREMVKNRGMAVTTTADLVDVLRLVFRTLNIDSAVEVKGRDVLVTNYHCPYLVSAQQRGISGTHMCEMICGEDSSMLVGINQGLPLPVIYRTNGMMGRDGGVCQKRFARAD